MLHITNIVIEKHLLILPSSTQLYHFVPLLMFQSQAFPFGLLCHKDTTRQELPLVVALDVLSFVFTA